MSEAGDRRYRKQQRRIKKKERAKTRKQQQQKNPVSKKLQAESLAASGKLEIAFQQKLKAISGILKKYRPEDCAIALSAFELWLPNAASTIKFPFFWGVLAGMPPQSHASVRIDTHEEFGEFCEALKAASPTFSMLEDFVPELDWGEVRLPFRGKQFKVLYGGSVERIVDFIGAFEISHVSLDAFYQGKIGRSPAAELECVLAYQDAIVSAGLPQARRNDFEAISGGHLEVPSEPFWTTAKNVLPKLQLERLFPPGLSDELTVVEGSRPIDATSAQAFTNAAYEGSWLPFLFFRAGSVCVPMNCRHASWLLLEKWYAIEREIGVAFEQNVTQESETFRRYVSKRISPEQGFIEEIHAIDSQQRPVARFDFALFGKSRIWLFRLLSDLRRNDKKTLDQYVPSVRRARRAITERPVLGLASRRKLARIAGPDESQPPSIEVVLLIPISTTAGYRYRIPEDLEARVLGLDAFLGIVDSLRSAVEIEEYFDFCDGHAGLIGPMAGPGDLLGAFADSHGVLVEGAREPSMIVLDPHWGSQYRFRTLQKRYEHLPLVTPDDDTESWITESGGVQGELLVLRRTDRQVASSYASWGDTDFFAIADYAGVDPLNGRLLSMVQECFTDTFGRRSPILLSNGAVTPHRRIAFKLHIGTRAKEPEFYSEPSTSTKTRILTLLDSKPGWQGLDISVAVDLDQVTLRLLAAQDATFEVDLLDEALSLIFPDWHERFGQAIKELGDTKQQKARFFLGVEEALVTFPDTGEAAEPEDRQFKIARRELAKIASAAGLTEGKYELEAGKALLNKVRDGMVQHLDGRVETLKGVQAIPFCIDQIEVLQHEYATEIGRTKRSFAHEVDYDRVSRAGELGDAYLRNHRNFRYLIEKLAAKSPVGSAELDPEKFRELVAFVDWLLVVYQASDALHYGVHTVGLVVNSDLTLRVEYGADVDAGESFFRREKSEDDLELRGNPKDVVRLLDEKGEILERLDLPFKADLGFRTRSLWGLLQVMYRWPILNDLSPATHYAATRSQLVTALSKHVVGWDPSDEDALFEFMTLRREGLTVLLGETEQCKDIPVWEHSKRRQRYTITPLIKVGETYCWGAYSARKALTIWQGNIKDGNLPAAHKLPRTRPIVEGIKRSIEKALVTKAHEISRRHTDLCEKEVDLASRFPQSGFGEELGDYDVLAYLRESNRILAMECKDNNPPFCLKDARRLRTKIFGTTEHDESHVSKIVRRHEFLSGNIEKVATLMKWPIVDPAVVKVTSLYVSRRTYWWFRVPPYPVNIEFVRIDALDDYLQGAAKK